MVEISREDIAARAFALGIDFSAIDIDSISLPPGDDLGIISDDDEDAELKFSEDFSNIIVVDNLPIVPREKFWKLERVIRRIFEQIGVIKDDGICMHVDFQTPGALGYCYIEYSTSEEAKLARESMHGFKLDKSHTFNVNEFDDIEKFMNVPDEWAPSVTKPYTSVTVAYIPPGENLQLWLTDKKARDQFVIRAGSDTEIFWNDAGKSKPNLFYKYIHWIESFVQWSPLGTYLAMIHAKGAIVWGGATTFNRLGRYAHPQVKLIDFSPGERFLVTYSNQEPTNPGDTHSVVIIIFDVRTVEVMKEFKGSAEEFAVGGVTWPIFRWGGGKEDKYFARLSKNVISIYETETFALIDSVDNVVDFCWSPTDSILALLGNQPAKVSLLQIPSKEELRQKNLLGVTGCKMFWQSGGEYLAVQVEHYTETKKSVYTEFELFRIKEQDIPVEVIELENKNDKIIAFAWEPKGHRFAVIHGDSLKPDISFYSVNTGRVLKLITLKEKQANALYWSPAGRFIILAGLKDFNGQLEFYDVDQLETMASAEHYMTSYVEWDPTGRYVATAVTCVHEIENGFNVWMFNGKLLYRILKDHIFQFMWRPRPPSPLSAEKEEKDIAPMV